MDGSTLKPKNAVSTESNKVQSPETYFGSSRNSNFGNGQFGLKGVQTLQIGHNLKIRSNYFYLEGTWNFSEEFATSKSDGKILFKYNAKNVYMVASSETGLSVTILKDGKFEKILFIKGNQLYALIEDVDYEEHTLEINVPAGINAFTFTFV